MVTLAIGAKEALDAVDWSGGSTFLQVELDASGGDNFVDMGTTQLLSVPYAMYAGRAGSLDNANNGSSEKATTTLSWNCTTHTLTNNGASVVIANCNGTF